MNLQVPVVGGFEISYPRMVRVQQKFNPVKIANIREEIHRQFAKEAIKAKIKPGMQVVVGVGSRGISNLPQIVKAVVDEIKQLGGLPVIVPAMGSHGGAAASGQREVLAGYGITEISMACPIVDSMDTVQVGKMSNGLPLFFSKCAYESDAIVVINRVKPHTSFKGPIESGLLKMLAIGLGKHRGATSIHSFGVDRFRETIPEAGRILIEKAKVAFGVALLENAYDETCEIAAIPAEEIYEQEQLLLKKAKALMPKILLNEIDVLVIDEFGKEISGAGMDPNVTGRITTGLTDGFNAPSIQKIVLRDLTDKSHGNALGVGMADIITKKLFDKIDFSSMYANAVTATVLTSVKIPMILPSDKEALAVAVKTCNRIVPEKIKIVWIKNTLDMEFIYVSEAYADAISRREDLAITKDYQDIRFDADGNLATKFVFR